MIHSQRISSDQFATGPFRPHGRVELLAQGKIIHLTASGPFNMEAVNAIGAAWRQMFADSPAEGPFADIVTVAGSMMAGPDVMRAFGSFLQANTAAHISPCAVAWVVPADVEGAVIMIPQFRQVYEAAGRNIAFFDSAEPAQAWVLDQLQQAQADTRAPSTPNTGA